MAELSLTALQDTVIKRFTIDSTDIDNPGEKFDLEKGEKIGINWYRPASKNHGNLNSNLPTEAFSIGTFSSRTFRLTIPRLDILKLQEANKSWLS